MAGPEAEAAHSECEAPSRLWGARMEQTPERAARSGERGRAAAFVPCGVGVAGPEAARCKRRRAASGGAARRVAKRSAGPALGRSHGTNALSLRDVGHEGRVGATLSRPKGARSPSPRKHRAPVHRDGTPQGRPLHPPIGGQPYIRVVPCTEQRRTRTGGRRARSETGMRPVRSDRRGRACPVPSRRSRRDREGEGAPYGRDSLAPTGPCRHRRPTGAFVPWKVGVAGREAARCKRRRGPARSVSEGASLPTRPGRLWGAHSGRSSGSRNSVEVKRRDRHRSRRLPKVSPRRRTAPTRRRFAAPSRSSCGRSRRCPTSGTCP